MHMPDPTPSNQVETRLEPDGGTWMTLRMTLPNAQTRAALLPDGNGRA
jgi:hypothetical protein